MVCVVHDDDEVARLHWQERYMQMTRPDELLQVQVICMLLLLHMEEEVHEQVGRCLLRGEPEPLGYAQAVRSHTCG